MDSLGGNGRRREKKDGKGCREGVDGDCRQRDPGVGRRSSRRRGGGERERQRVREGQREKEREVMREEREKGGWRGGEC